jgi:hypothetical protein
MRGTLRQIFPGARFTEIDISEEDLISDLDIDVLPAYLFDESIEQTSRFDQAERTLVKEDDIYYMKPSAAGSSYFFKRSEDEGSVKLFLNPFHSASVEAFDNLVSLSEERDIDIEIKFYTRKDLNRNDIEILELFRQVCIRQSFEQDLIDYMKCLSDGEISETSQSSCLAESGIGSDDISDCVEREAEGMIEEDILEAEEFYINTVPVFIFNNQYKQGGSLSVDILDDIYCSINEC